MAHQQFATKAVVDQECEQNAVDRSTTKDVKFGTHLVASATELKES